MVQSLLCTHPWRSDAAYQARRNEIASQATGVGCEPRRIAYRPSEHGVWAEVQRALGPELLGHACAEINDARRHLALDELRVEQLGPLSDRLEPLTGFRYQAVPGL